MGRESLMNKITLLLLVLFSSTVYGAKVSLDPSNWGAVEGESCVSCHEKASIGIHKQWKQGGHAKAGVNCFDCHQADPADIDAHEHEGGVIATIVTPKDCGRCHVTEYKQSSGSTHSQALLSLEEKKGLSHEQIEKGGCISCHGNRVEIKGDGTINAGDWPNGGIGRVNPDGSLGNCSACHSRHRFSLAEARSPAACGRCHSGSESPDLEVYQSSKHGIIYEASRDEMNLHAESWVAGEDYHATVTCASCHMGAAPGLKPTHDVGMRDSWSLRSEVSEPQSLIIFKDGSSRNWSEGEDSISIRRGDELPKVGGGSGKVKAVASSKRRAKAMDRLCMQCHSKSLVRSFRAGYDRVLEEYNGSIGIPGRAIMRELYRRELLTPEPLDEPLEQSWWGLWHDYGIYLRHAAAMGGRLPIPASLSGEFTSLLIEVAGEELSRELLREHLPEGATAVPGVGSPYLDASKPLSEGGS